MKTKKLELRQKIRNRIRERVLTFQASQSDLLDQSDQTDQTDQSSSNASRDQKIEDLQNLDSSRLHFEISEPTQNVLFQFLKNYPGLWGVFAALPGEVRIRTDQAPSEIQWAFPKVISEGQPLEFYSASKLICGYRNIFEPDLTASDTHRVERNELVGVLVPALALDRSGHRLGYGKGFYDRSFENYQGVLIGVTAHENFLETVPAESHDLKVDWILTEKEFCKAQS